MGKVVVDYVIYNHQDFPVEEIVNSSYFVKNVNATRIRLEILSQYNENTKQFEFVKSHGFYKIIDNGPLENMKIERGDNSFYVILLILEWGVPLVTLIGIFLLILVLSRRKK